MIGTRGESKLLLTQHGDAQIGGLDVILEWDTAGHPRSER